jgi:hypothetical protein
LPDWDRLSFSDDLLGDVVIPVKDVAEAKFQVNPLLRIIH